MPDHFFHEQMRKRPILTTILATILIVAVASGTGVLGAITKPIGRLFGGLKFYAMRLFGIDRRKG